MTNADNNSRTRDGDSSSPSSSSSSNIPQSNATIPTPLSHESSANSITTPLTNALPLSSPSSTSALPASFSANSSENRSQLQSNIGFSQQPSKTSSSSTPQQPIPSSYSYASSASTSNWNIYDLAYWVPLRLTADERSLLTVLEQTLHVSEYTDNVDVTMYGGGSGFGGSSNGNSNYRKYNGTLSSSYSGNNTMSSTASMKTRRILDGIFEVCHIATGLATASGHERKFVDLCYSYHHYYNHEHSDSFTQQQRSVMMQNENGSNGESGISSLVTSFLNKGNKLTSKQERREMKKQLLEEKKAKKILRKQEKNLKKQQHSDRSLLQSVARNHNNGGSTSETKSIANVNASQPSKQLDGSVTSPTTKVPLHQANNHHSHQYYSRHIPWASHEPKDNAILFQTMFEIGRRNKVLNPSSMRTTYGKMMYMLQDSQNPTVAQTLGFSLHKDLLLIGPYLERNHCIELLHDPRLECAIQYIDDRDIVTGEKLPRETLQVLLHGKSNVMEELILKYSRNDDVSQSDDHHSRKMTKTSNLTKDEVRRVIESLADAVVYIESNVRPVLKMLEYLKQNFHPEIEQPRSAPSSSSQYASLALRGRLNGGYGSSNSQYRYGISAYNHFGSNSSEGPTLTHSHSEQYTFVEQSLRLWSKVMRHMHRLWVCADDDLLSTTCTYHLYNTGQGLNRVQACPKVRKMMSSLLHQTQQESGRTWVGLSVIHLGDRDVPNALIFIDKYTQIPRFLNPISNLIISLPNLMNDTRTARYVMEQFGSIQTLKMAILQDYYKHGFDGSGDDGGSCIDGRLTSSWNWTSRLAKKNYYHIFMLSGFQGFDGDFR